MTLLIASTDYTFSLDSSRPFRLTRKLHEPERFEAWLLLAPGATPPPSGARVILSRTDGHILFTGYLQPPTLEPLGFSANISAYRAHIIALGDQSLLDHKPLPLRASFTQRTAGAILKQITRDLALTNVATPFDTSSINDLLPLTDIVETKSKRWSDCARDLALRARGIFRVHDGKVTFTPPGATTHTLDESAANFNPEALAMQSPPNLINEVLVHGPIEPGAHCKDYFQGDGLTLNFPLSHKPFNKFARTILLDEYEANPLIPFAWIATDPVNALSIADGKLIVNGGTGSDAGTVKQFTEQIEIGGTLTLQHGDVTFSAASTGIIGGLYTGDIAIQNCWAGFRITPSTSVTGQSIIQPLIQGAAAGTLITTTSGHRYLLTTRIYCTEVFRTQQSFCSSSSPNTSPRGGSSTPADARIILEVHDVDPANLGTLAAPATVLYDGVLTGAPYICSYAVINAASMFCSLSFTRIVQEVTAEVRSTIPSQTPRVRTVGLGSEGAQCNITSSPSLLFFSPYVPVQGESIVVRYRSQHHAAGLASNISSQVSLRNKNNGMDDGIRAASVKITTPPPRTTPDCINAALAFLDDTTQTAWQGSYSCLSDLFPSGNSADPLPGFVFDPLPGHAIHILAPSRNINCTCYLHQVDMESVSFSADVGTLADDRLLITLHFANEAATPLSRSTTNALPADGFDLLPPQQQFTDDLPHAEIIATSSTTVTIDSGIAPSAGCQFEVRRTDTGWGATTDRNLVGRFTTQQFTVPRLARVQDYYIRYLQNGLIPLYSQNSTALHIDFPL